MARTLQYRILEFNTKRKEAKMKTTIKKYGPCDSCGECSENCICGDYINTTMPTEREITNAKKNTPAITKAESDAFFNI